MGLNSSFPHRGSPLTSKICRYRQIKIIKGPVLANLGGKELSKKIKNTTHQQV